MQIGLRPVQKYKGGSESMEYGGLSMGDAGLNGGSRGRPDSLPGHMAAGNIPVSGFPLS